MKINIEIEALTPIHLGSGKADVNVDAEVIHDKYGRPYFPARRLKGILEESFIELSEMSERSGMGFLTREEVDRLFHRTSDEAAVQLVFSDCHVEREADYRAATLAWEELSREYASVFSAADVLESYTSLRYETRLVDGVAAKGSLRNLRVINKGTKFYGVLEILGEGAEKYLPLLAAAFKNLRRAGGKRNRGFGCVACRFAVEGGPESEKLLKQFFKEASGK